MATKCPPRSRLLGWVTSTPTGEIHVQETPDNACAIVKKCPNVLSPATTAAAGGTGYDPRWRGVWSSDGATIELTGIDKCDSICRGSPSLALTGSQVSGLAVNDSRSQLYQLETVAGGFAITTYDIRDPKTSCFTRVASCTGRTLTATGVAAGLAYDEVRRLLYISTSEGTATTGFTHHILVTRADAPCNVICNFQIPNQCLSDKRVLTGLAYEGCKPDMIYATDGVKVLEIQVVSPDTCGFKVARCCDATGDYRGLATIPGFYAEPVGSSCLAAPCPTCPSMIATSSGGDPDIGNPNFGLELRDAPVGSPFNIGVLFLSAGQCGPGLPFSCGKVYAYPANLGILPVAILGSTGCTGTAKYPLPLTIPPTDAFCGVPICSQWLILCPASSGPAGIGLSNAFEFVITGT